MSSDGPTPNPQPAHNAAHAGSTPGPSYALTAESTPAVPATSSVQVQSAAGAAERLAPMPDFSPVAPEPIVLTRRERNELLASTEEQFQVTRDANLAAKVLVEGGIPVKEATVYVTGMRRRVDPTKPPSRQGPSTIEVAATARLSATGSAERARMLASATPRSTAASTGGAAPVRMPVSAAPQRSAASTAGAIVWLVVGLALVLFGLAIGRIQSVLIGGVNVALAISKLSNT